ncbi:MAG TPA: 50S ribosomal protein L32 [Candidatus Paceibacterota bacterium]|nr:50S ribosomal protein L32 [Candidatus Paceibacterota bacterium]HOK97293.1 50S ribosomal protein L32 [Candidatus Paceibacterota bacterium]HPP64729.1 50S ribosomal protein L32 [Candidatus Paceibacterota bacterium]
MGLPARHHSKSRRNKGRSHMALKPSFFIKCPHCGREILPHRVCPYCGYYKEKEYIDVFKGLNKKEKKKKEKELKEESV